MRRMTMILALLLFVSSSAFAQEKGKVKKYVEQQIKSAIGLEKMEEERSSNAVIILKGIILLAASVGSFGFVFYRRKKISQAQKEEELKDKIKKLRDEKITYQMEPRLKMIRRKLSETVPDGKINLKLVPQSAKRLNIAQEEILLAARLNFYSKQNGIGGSIA